MLFVHPIIQLAAIITAFCAAYLGLQRARSLHFSATVNFKRNLHAGLGAAALVTLLMGLAGGLIMTSRLLEHHKPLESFHGKSAMALLPFLMVGIFTGFYLYVAPSKGKLLSAVHGVNNAVVLLFLLLQIASGIGLLSHVL